MRRIVGLLIGLIAGVGIAGVGVALLIPQLPDAWRTQWLTWSVSGALIAVAMTVAFAVSGMRQ
jgi:hypothetical protein